MASFVQHVGFVDGLSVTISLSLTYTLLILGLRLYIRNKIWGVDDLCVSFATLITLVHFGTSYFCLSHGMGKPYQTHRHHVSGNLNQATVADAVTFVLSIYAAKIATLVFMMRIASVMRTRLLYYACIAIAAVSCLGSILLVTVECQTTSGYYWDVLGNSSGCPSQSKRWRAMTILDIITEMILLVLPFQIVWSLQMARGTKALVVATFWTRLPVIGLTVVRQYYVQRLGQPSSEKGLTSALVVVLMEIEATYALASCTIATARNFMDNFNTGFGVGHIRGAAEEYNMSNLGSSMGRTASSRMDTISSPAPGNYGESGHRPNKKVSRRGVQDMGASKEHGIALRPDHDLRNQAYIKSNRRKFSEDSSTGGDSDEQHILQQREFVVSHE